ncbi:MAG: type II toxin-antitoxin system VapC family toxin [Melioribacteraceae bacterium]|nr:type II toxin-antitoxin system VapC family toxin [Melioribacteraceae bacterium]
MSKKGILLDTDIIIWFLRGKEEYVRQIEMLVNENRLFVSPISVTEIYAVAKKNEERNIHTFFDLLEIITIKSNEAKTAGLFIQQYRKSHSVELADALIAATAKENELLLWTLNKKHYPMLNKNEFYKD